MLTPKVKKHFDKYLVEKELFTSVTHNGNIISVDFYALPLASQFGIFQDYFLTLGIRTIAEPQTFFTSKKDDNNHITHNICYKAEIWKTSDNLLGAPAEFNITFEHGLINSFDQARITAIQKASEITEQRL